MFIDRSQTSCDTAIVGGGLAGLSAAAFLARGGESVVVLEKSRTCGGRARTRNHDGFQFNQGPHALYLAGEAHRTLKELQVPFTGAHPPQGWALAAGRTYPLPRSLTTILNSRLLSLKGKWAVTSFLSRLGKIDSAAIASVGLTDWLAGEIRDERAREFLAALFKISTYAADQRRLSAGAAVDQLRLGLHGVIYLDGGWQTIVDGLQRDVQTRGGRLQAGRRVAAIERDDESLRLQLADGGQIACRSVVLAVAPEAVAELLPEAAEQVVGGEEHPPVLAACLDVALSRLPEPRQLFFLGLDRPVYASVHSAAAKLAPGDAALVHIMKYLDRPADDSAAVEQELESLLDQFQPGWRAELVERRYLPNMRAAERLPAAAGGGLRGRPAVALPRCDDIYLAGDWVGSAGMLADASFASGRRAAELILAKRGRKQPSNEAREFRARRGETVC